MGLSNFGADENELIGEIYEAALDESRWQSVLLRLREMIAVKDCNLIFHDAQNRGRNTIISSTITAAVRAEYLERYIDDDVRWGRVFYGYRQNGGDVVSSQELSQRVGMERDKLQDSKLSRWYRETLRYGDQLALFLLVENYSLAALTVNREIGQPPTEIETHRLLDRLKPHLNRALAIHHQLATARQEYMQLQSLLERTAAGVMLIDGDGRVAFANREALRIVDKGDRLRIATGGRLVGAASETDVALQTAIQQSIERRQLFSDAATTFAVSHQSYRQPLQLSVIPVLSDADMMPILRQTPTLIFVIDPARRWTVSDAYMQKAYALTPAECAVSAALAGGDSARQIAAWREVSEGTVREQLNSILEKTGSATQRELALLLFNLRDDFARPVD